MYQGRKRLRVLVPPSSSPLVCHGGSKSLTGSIKPEPAATRPAAAVVTPVTATTLIQPRRLGTVVRESRARSVATESHGTVILHLYHNL
mmetsp:Transcript_3373/g.7254  ORF Transcript_3373/g.7254 Transcript_3373/m.7254 type:complete len:89 (-) Transcript_3373:438-704(-)